jgi:hypothetical protein
MLLATSRTQLAQAHVYERGEGLVECNGAIIGCWRAYGGMIQRKWSARSSRRMMYLPCKRRVSVAAEARCNGCYGAMGGVEIEMS